MKQQQALANVDAVGTYSCHDRDSETGSRWPAPLGKCEDARYRSGKRVGYVAYSATGYPSNLQSACPRPNKPCASSTTTA